MAAQMEDHRCKKAVKSRLCARGFKDKDGNTVELHVEQLQFSENVMRYQTSLEFLNRKISGLMSAIKGE